jgi:hypothetical protein
VRGRIQGQPARLFQCPRPGEVGRFRYHERGAEAICANGLSLRSSSLGKVRAHLGWAYAHKYERGPDAKHVRGRLMTPDERIADRLQTDDYYVKSMKRGGAFALAVEHHTAVADGETERAPELNAAIEREREAALRAFRAMMRG